MRLISVLIILLVFSSCKDDKPPQPIAEMKNGMLVLCEGLYQQSNSSLSWVDYSNSEVSTNFYSDKNGQNLGDTGNDMKIYGSKIYLVITGSSTIEVLNAKTGVRIKQIPMLVGSSPKSPRSVTFHDGKAFVACQDGFVDIIDTISLSVVSRIQVGSNPEDLVIASNKLYVSNSGGLNYPNYDSTVSVVNLSTYDEISKITVGKNPGKLMVDEQQEVYVITRGDYSTIPSRMHRINTAGDFLEQSFSFDALGIAEMGNNFLITHYDYSSQQHTIRLFNPWNETLLLDPYFSASEVQTLYGIKYDESRDKIFCLDAMNFTNTGYIRQYAADGTFEKSFHVGLNPTKILLYD